MLLGLLVTMADQHFGGHAHQFGIRAQQIRLAGDAQHADQALIVHQRQVDTRLHALEVLGGLAVDFHHAPIGQHQLRPLMAGVDALGFTAAQDQPLAVHDVDVVGQNRHGPIDDILRQVMIQLEHGGHLLEKVLHGRVVHRHSAKPACLCASTKTAPRRVAETRWAINVTRASRKIIINRENAMSQSAAAPLTTDDDKNAIYKRITLRLIPFIFICYLFNYLDRVNVGFAKLQMLDALKFSETVYGLGAGIFFIGYVLCGVPSNLALTRFGPRRWIALMMIVWGTLSTCLLFVTTPTHFYTLRLFTGAAEAGFFPGVVLYLAQWFPTFRRGRIMALFMSAIPVSGLLGSPFSGWILNHFAAGQGGLAGWQWMFLLQGIPTVILGALAYFLLSDSFANAKWLTPHERAVLETDQATDQANKPKATTDSLGQVFKNPAIWAFGLIYFCIQSGVYAINFWLPSIIKNLGFSDNLVIGWLSAVPYLLAAVFMLLVGRSADLRKERRWHLVVPMLMGAIGLVIAVNFATTPALAILGLTIATMGALTGLPMFWPVPTAMLSAGAAAGGLALINSMGQMAGFLSPYIVGFVKDATGSTDMALYLLAAVIVAGSVLALRMTRSLNA